jgi:hypothetical protein
VGEGKSEDRASTSPRPAPESDALAFAVFGRVDELNTASSSARLHFSIVEGLGSLPRSSKRFTVSAAVPDCSVSGEKLHFADGIIQAPERAMRRGEGVNHYERHPVQMRLSEAREERATVADPYRSAKALQELAQW